MNRILILGPLPHQNHPRTYGGATIAMQNLVDYCSRNNISHGFIQTNKYVSQRIPMTPVNLLYVLSILAVRIHRYDVVMLNVSSRGALFSGSLIYAVCRLFRKKTVFRKFGGAWETLLNGKNRAVRNRTVESLMKSNLILVETKQMIKYLHDGNISNTLWFPNVRKAPRTQPAISQGFSKKFVFISQVTRDKGIPEIIRAAEMLSADYTVDIYGPIRDHTLSEKTFLHSGVNYKGALTPGQVVATLKEYDVLMLPTYYKDEGYPGIIIEALSLGIPVISTRFRSIPEIIDEKNGILVKPRDHQDLYHAISRFTEENILSYRQAALRSFSSFNEDTVYASALKAMYSL